MSIIIYCDGSCLGNPGPGGWAAILFIDDKKIEISGGESYTTNNRMELSAAIMAMREVESRLIAKTEVDIYTDSQYLKNGITAWISQWKKNNWRAGTIKNIDLWQSLDILQNNILARWHWVKAHNGDKYNEEVDLLAKQAARSQGK